MDVRETLSGTLFDKSDTFRFVKVGYSPPWDLAEQHRR